MFDILDWQKTLLEEGAEYAVWSPYDAYEAAQVLLMGLNNELLNSDCIVIECDSAQEKNS